MVDFVPNRTSGPELHSGMHVESVYMKVSAGRIEAVLAGVSAHKNKKRTSSIAEPSTKIDHSPLRRQAALCHQKVSPFRFLKGVQRQLIVNYCLHRILDAVRLSAETPAGRAASRHR